MAELLRDRPREVRGAARAFRDAARPSSPVFGDDRQALAAAVSSPQPVRVHAELIREGDESDRVHFVTEGWACRFKTTRDGSRQIVALLVPGDVANLDTLTFSRASYGVRMLTAGKVASISRQNALALAEANAGTARTLTRLALVENAILSQWALCLGRLSARARLAHLLCELAVRLGQDGDGSVTFDLPLTQEQLADSLGLTAVHVNRTVGRLRQEGLVAPGHRSMTLPDVTRLRQAAEFDGGYLRPDGGEGVADIGRSIGQLISVTPAKAGVHL